MKNQYFGDARDYFKYDLLDRLASDLPQVRTLALLWMLTGPDGKNHGQVAFVPDPELPELTRFFHERLDPRDDHRCRVSEMPLYFARRPFETYSYRDDREDFAPWTRDAYFRDLPEQVLRDAVVFFDPDNGMEPKNTTAAHLRFDELAGVLDRMGESSVAVVFQFQRRVHGWVATIAREIALATHRPVAHIVEGPLAFYVISRLDTRHAQVLSVLESVATRSTPRRSGHRRVGETLPD
jgi:hypothetical protein